jgi:hypothetical protein
MTPAELAKRLKVIEVRAAQATELPWDAVRWEDDHGNIAYDVESPNEPVTSKIACAVETRHDAEFIAHAREDVPFLLELIAQHAGERAQLQEQLSMAVFNQNRNAANAVAACEQLRQESTALRDALRTYGKHTQECAKWVRVPPGAPGILSHFEWDDAVECTCGLAAFLLPGGA